MNMYANVTVYELRPVDSESMTLTYQLAGCVDVNINCVESFRTVKDPQTKKALVKLTMISGKEYIIDEASEYLIRSKG